MRRDALIRRIHSAAAAGVFVVTGGGSRLISDLLAVPGASTTVLDARVPYAAAALAQFIGAAPEQAVSEATACDMAMVAFLSAIDLAPSGVQPFGVAVTASLRTRASKRGEHRAHVALQTASTTRHRYLNFTKSLRTRAMEEALTRDLALGVIAAELGIDAHLAIGLHAGEAITDTKHLAKASWQAVTVGGSAIAVEGIDRGAPRVLMPGAFNPLHEGHRAMAQLASARLGADVAFELCVRNVDKPPLNYLTIAKRLAQFTTSDTVYLTSLPTFIAKARQFPGVTFVVGVDTLIRIAEPRYYGSASTRDDAIAELDALGTRFLVFGRRISDTFVNADDVDIPISLKALCSSVPESDFRNDVSSTQVRNGRDS